LNHRLALKTESTVWAYGPDNASRQLGTGNNTVYQDPQAVESTSGSGQLTGATELAAGMSFSLE
jgi:hypothetical protein